MTARPFDTGGWKPISQAQAQIAFTALTRSVIDAGLQALVNDDPDEALRLIESAAPKWVRLRDLVAAQAN